MVNSKDVFFAGWGKVPKELRLFLMSLALSLVAFFGVVAYLISATQNDPGDAAFIGRANAIGILQAKPYPVLHVIESKRYERGQAIMLNGNGKRGVIDRAADLDGKVVRINGVRLKRGDLDAMQLRGGMNGLREVDVMDGMGKSKRTADGFEIETKQLGRWKLSGEICDGKCLTGAMRPGSGLAHKACANLCLIGGVPPVFVSSSPVEGSEFLMMSNEDGEAVTEDILQHTATYVEIEGDIERRGNLLVFKISPETISVIK